MSTKPRSRWANEEEDAALDAQKKREKELKKRVKAEKLQKAAEDDEARRQQERQRSAQSTQDGNPPPEEDVSRESKRPAKRRKLSPSLPAGEEVSGAHVKPAKLLRFPTSTWQKSRSVEDFDKLNDIEEGAYGWVSRARDTTTGRIVALKRLKMDNVQDGIPVTGLREIQTLKACSHPNIVTLHEVVIGEDRSKVEKCVYPGSSALQVPRLIKSISIFLVLTFLEHDLKTLLSTLTEPFLPSELKTLLSQLVAGVKYLHDHAIIHRDLKTSNLLLSNRGVLQIADFGMARYFSPPAQKMTALVVTLWYRAPELLLGADTYGAEVDMWSVGCIFGELLTNEPLLQGKNEVDELTRIFELCGIPDDSSWPGFRRLPNARSLRMPASANPVAQGSVLRAKFPFLTSAGCQLLVALLSLNPAKRPSAEMMLQHPYFREDPKPKRESMMPTFPSKAGLEKRRKRDTPEAPKRGQAPGLGAADFSGIFAGRESEEKGGGFALKLI